MKVFFLLLFLSVSSLFSASIYTLDNVHDLSLYIDNQTNFMDKKELKDKVSAKLEKAGFVFGKTDALTLVIKIQSVDIEESMAISVFFGLGEEVVTHRQDDIETFSYTYVETKLFEAYEPKEDTTEALNNLIDDFIEAYKDDNSE